MWPSTPTTTTTTTLGGRNVAQMDASVLRQLSFSGYDLRLEQSEPVELRTARAVAEHVEPRWLSALTVNLRRGFESEEAATALGSAMRVVPGNQVVVENGGPHLDAFLRAALHSSHFVHMHMFPAHAAAHLQEALHAVRAVGCKNLTLHGPITEPATALARAQADALRLGLEGAELHGLVFDGELDLVEAACAGAPRVKRVGLTQWTSTPMRALRALAPLRGPFSLDLSVVKNDTGDVPELLGLDALRLQCYTRVVEFTLPRCPNLRALELVGCVNTCRFLDVQKNAPNLEELHLYNGTDVSVIPSSMNGMSRLRVLSTTGETTMFSLTELIRTSPAIETIKVHSSYGSREQTRALWRAVLASRTLQSFKGCATIERALNARAGVLAIDECFVEDGDHAIAARVLRFLLPRLF